MGLVRTALPWRPPAAALVLAAALRLSAVLRVLAAALRLSAVLRVLAATLRLLLAVALASVATSAEPAPPAPCAELRGTPYDARTFFGYDCAGDDTRDRDCGDLKAGFAAAARLGLADAGACIMLAARLRDGCRAYVDEGLTARDAGHAWAAENEIRDPCLCRGAGDEFEAGCREQLSPENLANS